MKSLLMFHGGIRSAKKTLVDGEEHTLYFKAKTPAEITAFVGSQQRLKDNEEGDKLRQKQRAEFIASSMCDEDGKLEFTVEEAMLIPATLKPELCQMILVESNTPGESGKRLPPEEKTGTGES
jgi:hypothetical protein